LLGVKTFDSVVSGKLEVGREIDMVLVATHFFAKSLNSFGTRSDFKDMILLLYLA